MNKVVGNIIKGFFAAVMNWFVKVTIPIAIFTYLSGYDVLGIEIFSEEKVAIITYWIWGVGIITTAIRFWVASSPKYSVRKAIAEIFLLAANLFYMYVYRFSGIMEFENISISLTEKLSTSISLNLNNLIYASMGLMGLNIIIYLYDLILAIFSPIEPNSNKNEKEIKKSQKKSKKRNTNRNVSKSKKKNTMNYEHESKSHKKLEYKSVFGDDIK
ncbi:MAG: hypothetical protein K9W44_11255 [Candidatus Lokiarchaeota archaeon]|nr:hypothetical protein [Candidatus Harpocratesius repetitus]